ncbi:hypothetical protein BGZ76_005576 [Entomortierella beljakovae]|nr:hypothetical protein BGZ76_005576 [Entomortierella beljakovae]
MLEKRAQSFEEKVHELKRLMETERQANRQELMDLRLRLNDKCSKLEQEAQASKMESKMYTEMMHEVVSENDDLRKKVKIALRKLRRHGEDESLEESDSVYGSDDDDMEEIII